MNSCRVSVGGVTIHSRTPISHRLLGTNKKVTVRNTWCWKPSDTQDFLCRGLRGVPGARSRQGMFACQAKIWLKSCSVTMPLEKYTKKQKRGAFLGLILTEHQQTAFNSSCFAATRCYIHIDAGSCPDWSSPQLGEHERGGLLGVFKYVLTGPSSQLHAVKTSSVQNIKIIFNLV